MVWCRSSAVYWKIWMRLYCHSSIHSPGLSNVIARTGFDGAWLWIGGVHKSLVLHYRQRVPVLTCHRLRLASHDDCHNGYLVASLWSWGGSNQDYLICMVSSWGPGDGYIFSAQSVPGLHWPWRMLCKADTNWYDMWCHMSIDLIACWYRCD